MAGNKTTMKKFNCVNCNTAIPAARIKALELLGVPQNEWTHTSCSTVMKKQGLFEGENGTSRLMIVNRIYDDTVRSILTKPEADPEEPEAEEPAEA